MLYSSYYAISVFASVTVEAVYGIEISERHDRYYEMAERMAEVAKAVTIPGNFPVEAFPALRYVPSWFPGGAFKKWAADAKRNIAYTVD